MHLLGPLRKHHTQYTLIPAAAGDKDGFAEFTLGDLRNVGVGSLFKITDGGIITGKSTRGNGLGCESCPNSSAIGHATVPVIRLSSILDRLHPAVALDTLKIDAQSADHEVLRGVGTRHLRRFRCVIGEFGAGGYVVPEERAKGGNGRAALTAAGFRFYRGVWYNTAARSYFETTSEQNLCFNHEMKRPHPNADIVAFLRTKYSPEESAPPKKTPTLPLVKKG